MCIRDRNYGSGNGHYIMGKFNNGFGGFGVGKNLGEPLETTSSPYERITFYAYPNPTNGNITININGTLTYSSFEICVFNFLGEKIISKKVHGLKNEMNISHLPGGIYLLTLSYGEQKEMVKRIVKL